MDENNENARNIIIEIDLENPSPVLQPTPMNDLLDFGDLIDEPLQNSTTDSWQLSTDKTHETREGQSITCDSCASYTKKINMYKQQLDSMEQEAINRREKLANSYDELKKVLTLKKELIEKYSVNDESSKAPASGYFSKPENNIYSYGYSDAGPSDLSKNKNQFEWYISSDQSEANVQDEYMKGYHEDVGKNKHPAVIDGIELFSNVLLNHIHSLEFLKLEQEYNNYFDEEGNLICSFPDFASYVRAGQVLHNLRRFELTYWIEIASNNVTEEKIIGLLNKVIESSTVIRQIAINMPSLLETQPIVPLLSKLISRQRSLETLEFDGRWDSSISNTLCLSIHSNLKYLRINNLTTIIELLPILNSWTHLDTLVLCRPQVIDDFTKINVDTLPPIFIRKLLIYDVGSDRKILDNFVGLLLRLANRHLKVFSLQECITPKLCKILVEYCRNLTHLSTIINTIDLSSLCTTLKYLPSIEHLIIVQSNSNSSRQRSWMISNSCGVNRHSWETKSLKCLASSFPPCLKYLGMCINFSVTQLKILLQNIDAPICMMEFCNVGGDLMMDKALELHFLRLMAEYAARNPGFCVLGLPENPEAWYDADFWKMAKDSIPVIK
ncbi:17987_t:CDS:2, partial [Racocetra fulgida]